MGGEGHSAAFPGLCLNPASLLTGDLPALLAALDQSIQTERHEEFVNRLREDK